MIYYSKFKNDNAGDLKNKLISDEPVIIFGTGNFGVIVCTALEKVGIKIQGFADNNEANWGSTFNGYKVYSHSEIKVSFSDRSFIIASLSYVYIKKQLSKFGIKNFFDCDFLFSLIDLNLSDCNTNWDNKRCRETIDSYLFTIDSLKKRTSKKLRVKHLDLVLTEKCSLKCKDCSNLMQYYAKPVDEDFDQMMNGLDKFMNNIDFVNEVRLIGGEPLMYKRITDVIKKLLDYKNYEKIYIYTNGTIVPKGDKIGVYKDKKILFRISDYGDVSRNVEKLEQVLKDNNINYIRENIRSWQDCAIIDEYKRDLELTKHIYGNCCVNQYLTLLHGKLYLCPYQAHAENLKAIPISKEDHIDLNIHHENLKNKIEKLYFDKEYLKACNSCNGRDPNVATVEAAVQTKNPLPYKIIA